MNGQAIFYFGMIVNTLVTAMGMMSENMQRIQNDQSLAYPEQAFEDLLINNGVHHNALCEASRLIDTN